jgi:hypothetical protein
MTATAIRKWMPLVCFLVAATLFYFENRPAYKGYFSDDDFNNIGWPTLVGNDTYYHGLMTPKFDESNFRPVGFLYYRVMGRTFKLNYPPYVVAIQCLHGLNAIILFFLLRRLNLSAVAAGAGTLFYAFHAALMEAYWKPMYVFDLLCATLCLITLLLYVRGHWILALLSFWLAYKSKEVAVMLPVVLLAFEFLRGQRNWKRLIPFFAISLSFGLQALWHNAHLAPGNNYALHFTPQLLWISIAFYASAILFLPFAGLALLALPIFVRDRRLYIGLILLVSMLLPMLLLTGRLASVYLYVPAIGLAIVVAALASRTPRWAIALFFLLWLPPNYAMMRGMRREVQAHGDQARWYTTGLLEYSKRVPPLKTVVYQGMPSFMGAWGIQCAVQEVFGRHVRAVWYLDPRAPEALAEVPMAIVGYYPVSHSVKGLLRVRDELESYIRFTDEAPAFQLGPGWYNDDAAFRWTEPLAQLSLRRPAGAGEFEIVAYIPPESLRKEGPANITVIEDETALGTQTLSETRQLRWRLPNSTTGVHRIAILAEPARHGAGYPRDLGIAVSAIGYVAR